MSFYDTNPTSLGSGRIDPNPKLLATGFPVGLPEFPKTEGCHSECLEYFMTWSIWVGSSIWINFRKLDVSIQMYTTNKQNIDYQLTKVWKYLTNHPPQKKTNVIYNNQIHPPKFHHLRLPTRIPKKKVTIFLGFGCGSPKLHPGTTSHGSPSPPKLQLWWNQCVGSWTSGFHPHWENQGFEK